LTKTKSSGESYDPPGGKTLRPAASKPVARTAELTAEEVEKMAAKGLTKEWVEKQPNLYKAAETSPSKLVNKQLLPRKAMMEKILFLWKD
jgi:hypothetical protein